MTIFQEPINLRAGNIDRIAANAKRKGRKFDRAVFEKPERWRTYAIAQSLAVQRLAKEFGIEQHLHLWPDKRLLAKEPFLKMRKAEWAEKNPGTKLTNQQRSENERRFTSDYEAHKAWFESWHSRISEWPGQVRSESWQVPALPNEQVQTATEDTSTVNGSK